MNPALANLLANEAPLKPVLDAGIFVEPRDRSPATEAQRQGLFLSRLKICAPAVFCFAVPNGGRRTPWEKFHHKALGMVAGMTDLVCLWGQPSWRRGIFCAEFKNGRDMPTTQQIEVLNRLHEMGIPCGVYRNADTVLAHLREAGAPFITRENRL